MSKDDLEFEIQREIYLTQWRNIRQLWDNGISAIRYLATLIMLAIFPIRFWHGSFSCPRIQSTYGVDWDVKIFAGLLILIMGVITYLNQMNNIERSTEARKVVVEIEKEWGLYDRQNNFVYQKGGRRMPYSKFAEGERRMLSRSTVSKAYIVAITLTGLLFVLIA